MIEWLDRHLITGWRESWRFSSVQMAAVASAITGTIAASPDLLLSMISFLPSNHWLRLVIIAAVVLVVFILPTVARLWDQGAADGKPTE
jgi:hypothetical protein